MANKEVKESKPKKHYFKDMKAELKKVIWPTPKQTMNNTIAVIVFTLIIAVAVFLLDLVFDSINKYGVTPLQDKIQSSYKASHNTTTEEGNNESSGEEEGEESNSENAEGEENTEATENGVEANAETNSEE